jgi:peptidoglycan-associated lipoprotein
MLTWETTNATDVSVDTIGPVDPSGSRQVTPSDSTTYHLVAKGAGGTQDATARVTVNAAAAPPPEPAMNLTEQELFEHNVKDVYFDYDKYDIRAADRGALQGDAQFLQQHSNIHIMVEGYCDERGSTEYNLALGANRADAVKNALIQAGVAGDRIKTNSYGKEKPFCTESNESCWQQNRRGHLLYEK